MKPTVILRHRRENLKKCSLRSLEGRPGFVFYTYPVDPLPDLTGYLLLKVGAPPLTEKDAGCGIFLIDATWRLAQIMEKQVTQKLEARSLPSGYRTAYPRKQTGCPDPESGLSSIEAIYLAHRILGREDERLMSGYYWKDLFFEINSIQT